MRKLKLHPTTEIDDLARPEKAGELSLESPALDFFTDFQAVKPLVIESTVSAVEVQKLMIKMHVRLKFIVNENNQFIGIISADDLDERSVVKKVSEGFDRDEIGLIDLMTPKASLKALSYQEIQGATIAEVIETLKDSGLQHCLVTDLGTRKIRGIFSASDISRKLHLPINIQDKSSFYKVHTALS